MAFRQGLQEMGWVEGRNFRADYRWAAGDLDRMRVIAKDFVDLQPDVLFGGSTSAVLALLRETRTIPIVFTNLSDPIGTGVVASFARPGGNATGFAAFEYSVAGKWLEMLKEVAPATRRGALVFNPETAPYAHYYLSFMEAAAPALGVTANAVSVRTVGEMEAALEAHAREADDSFAGWFHLGTSRPADRTGGPPPPAGHLLLPHPRHRGWPLVLRIGHHRPLSTLGVVCRSHPQG
jgi:putative ABC transport system substrate-binding protein